jgi:hypothetical protein
MQEIKLGSKFKIKKDKLGAFPGTTESTVLTVIAKREKNIQSIHTRYVISIDYVDRTFDGNYMALDKNNIENYRKAGYVINYNINKFLDKKYVSGYDSLFTAYLYQINSDSNIICRKSNDK